MSTSTFVSTADAISGLNDPSMSDERESDIFLRGMAFAYTLSTFAALVVPTGLALTGTGLWSIVAFAALIIPSLALSLYCRSEGLSMELLAARSTRRRKITFWATTIALIVGFFAALSFHAATGHPLIDVGNGFDSGAPELHFGFPFGLVVGGLIGTAVAIYSLRRGRRLAEQREREQRLIEE
jgi:hypothetical protein